MKESTVNKITVVLTYIIGFLLTVLFLIFGWAVVEGFLWLISKF